MNAKMQAMMAKAGLKGAPAPEPEKPPVVEAPAKPELTAELEATLAQLKTAQATSDRVNPPEAQEALAQSLAPAPVEGAKKRGKAKAAEPAPSPVVVVHAIEATGEIEFVDGREDHFVIHVTTKTWPTSRKIAITFLPE